MHYICFSFIYAFPIDLFYIDTALYRDVALKTKKNKKKHPPTKAPIRAPTEACLPEGFHLSAFPCTGKQH